MNIQKNNHAAHTKIEIENVLPTEIEKRSFEIITEELEQEGIVLPEIQAPITKRCIHTSADFDYAKNLVYSEHAVEKALEAIRGGASIVTDTQMGRSGINKKRLAQYGGQVYCFMSDEDVAQAAKKNGTTRAVASMKKACELNEKLIFAIGNAPTALVRLYELIEDGKLTQPIKDINIIGNGPKALADITMVADNDKIDNGTWTCGKDGQSCPVTCGMPSALVSKLTVGGEN